MSVIFNPNATQSLKIGIPRYFQSVESFGKGSSLLTLYSPNATSADIETVKRSVNSYFQEKFGSLPRDVSVVLSSLTVNVVYDAASVKPTRLDLENLAQYVKQHSNLDSGFYSGSTADVTFENPSQSYKVMQVKPVYVPPAPVPKPATPVPPPIVAPKPATPVPAPIVAPVVTTPIIVAAAPKPPAVVAKAPTEEFKFDIECDHHNQGKRKEQEDTSVNYYEYPYGVYGVFDGHGGGEISKALVEKFKELPKYLKSRQGTSTEQAIKDFYLQADKDLLRDVVLNPKMSEDDDPGSTATVAILDNSNGKLYLANLGDSSTILYKPNGTLFENTSNFVSGTLLKETPRLDWNDPAETKRAEDAGLSVSGIGKYRRVAGNLNVSRAFGDYYFKYKKQSERKGEDRGFDNYDGITGGVSTIPIVEEVQLDYRQAYKILLACDGLWDYMKTNEVLDYVNKSTDKRGVCSQLTDYAIDVKKSGDNVSVMIVSLFPISPL